MPHPACLWCEEPVLPHEQDPWMARPFHVECAARSVLGSLGHLQGRCSCGGRGGAEGDPVGMSRREAAKAALAYAREMDRRERDLN